MKYCRAIFYLAIGCMLLSCGNKNSEKKAETSASETKGSSAVNQETAATNNNASSGDGITGYWKLFLEAYDDNSNHKLDEAERNKGIKNHYSFRFNADGSCDIMDMFKGHYEIKTENGKKILSVYRNRVPSEEEKDPPPDVYEIISMSNEELVVLENLGDHTFWVFRK